MNIVTTKMYALGSAAVSGVDGIAHKTMAVKLSSFLGNLEDLLHKMNNRILSPSAVLITSGNNNSTAITFTVDGGGVSGLVMTCQGWPIYLSALAANAMSGTPAVSTASNTIKKVLVVFSVASTAMVNGASSIASTAVTLGFVYGSAYSVSANAVSTGAQSAYFNLVPLPKAGAFQVPLGWLNIVNGVASGGSAISQATCVTDFRETQGYNLALLADRVQP